jgi:hypothetical protein
MFYRLPGSAHQKHADPTIVSRCAALSTILLGLLLFNACSGISIPASGSTNSVTNSTSGLNISAVLPSATVGSIYNASVNVSGGTSPYVFSLASGQLPAGVLLAPTAGTIAGTPPQVEVLILRFRFQIPRDYPNSNPCKWRFQTLRQQTEETRS